MVGGLNNSNKEFQAIIIAAMKNLALSERELAKELGVGYETICRWITGESTPLPPMQKLVLSTLHSTRRTDSIPEYQQNGRCDRCKDWIGQIFRILPNNKAICHNCLVIDKSERRQL